MDLFWKLKTPILFTVLSLSGLSASAAVCSRTLTFADGTVLSASQLNGEFNAITNCANSIDDSNIADAAAILPVKFSATIAGDALGRDGSTGVLSVNTDGVTIETNSDAIRVKDSGITTAKINDSAVTTAKINDLAVTTAKINDGAVTHVKMGALGQQTADVLSFTNTTASPVDITGMTVTITTTGRPVFLAIVSYARLGIEGAGSISATCNGWSGAQGPIGIINFLRGSTEISTTRFGFGSSLINSGTSFSPTSFSYIDAIGAGTYTYKVQGYTIGVCSVSRSFDVGGSRLIAYEL